MKKVLLSVLAVGMLTACSQDETVDMQAPSQIAFAGAFVDNVTRAADPSTTTANIKFFDVWGFINETAGIILDGKEVSKETGVWTYSPVQYWYPNNTYRFFALTSNTKLEEGVSANVSLETATPDFTNGLGEISFTNVDGTEDLLFADCPVIKTPASITTQPDPVTFNFHHLLSKVKFTFKNGFKTGLTTIKVEDVKMVAPTASASITLNAQLDKSAYEWSGHEGDVTLDFGNMGDVEVKETGTATSNNERLTIPAGDDVMYTVTFKVIVYQNGVKAAESNKTTKITGCELLSGNAYNFVAELNEQNVYDDPLFPITFDAVVENWIENEYNGGVIPTNAVSTEAELAAAVAKGGLITLASDINLSESIVVTDKNVTINLNGKTIKCDKSDVFVATGGVLTLNGEGNVIGSEDNSSSACAVWAKENGQVIINGGTYKVGDDLSSHVDNGGDGNWRNDCIYARDNAKITINGGEFMYIGDYTAGHTFLLNCRDADYKAGKCSIVVSGGKFHKFNPGASNGENPVASYLADGCTSTETAENVWTVE